MIPFVGILPESEVIKGLKKIIKEQVNVVLSGTEHPAAFTDDVHLNYKPDNQKNNTQRSQQATI
ncbi:hypothetical protein SDC9_201286 [bioreactor metagenome]|uniref:Uncharacterized protein n=1 Tax=bioreactor metagenome TaxID=1076179 RepID=A0A645IS14_9ZZZZ